MYHAGCKARLSKAFTIATMLAVINDR